MQPGFYHKLPVKRREKEPLRFIVVCILKMEEEKKNFKSLKRFKNKFDCSVLELPYKKHLIPELNIQSAFIKAS